MKNKLKVKIIPSLVFGLINIVYCQVESKIYESYSDDYVVKAYDAFINDTVRYRKRTTNSQFDWVSELKTFDQVQAWVTLEWDMIYDRY